MASTTFTDFQTPAIPAAWLNDTNRLVYQLAGDGVNAPTNDSDVRDNLGITASIAAVPTTGRLIGVQTITSTSVYTPTAGTTSIVVELVGGGGGGGGSLVAGAGTISLGVSGSGAGYCRSRFTSGFSGQTVTIGAGGTAGAASGAGGTGGNSTFLGMVANGGLFGAVGNAATANNLRGNNPGGSASGGNIINISGSTVVPSWGSNAAGIAIGAAGGNSQLGNGGNATPTTSGVSSAGAAGNGFGAGGSGGVSYAAAAAAGGAGLPGAAIIYEYS